MLGISWRVLQSSQQQQQQQDTTWCSFLPEAVIESTLAAADCAVHKSTPASDIFTEIYRYRG